MDETGFYPSLCFHFQRRQTHRRIPSPPTLDTGHIYAGLTNVNLLRRVMAVARRQSRK